MYLSIPELKKAYGVTVIAAALTMGGCASKPTPPPQPTASEQLSKIVEVIDLIEQSRADQDATDNAKSEKMKAMITELGSEIDNIEDPANQKVAIASMLQFMERQSGAETTLLSEIFRIMMK